MGRRPTTDLSVGRRPTTDLFHVLPPRLFNEDDVRLGLAELVSKIINNVARTGQWPEQYKIEWGVPLQKEANPEFENQLRVISCTNQVSKSLEQVVISTVVDILYNR